MDHLLSKPSFMMGRSQLDQGRCYNDMTIMLKTFQKSHYNALETFLKCILMTRMRNFIVKSPQCCFSASVVTLTSLSAGVRLLKFLLFKFSD